jgi:hypothetical protein
MGHFIVTPGVIRVFSCPVTRAGSNGRCNTIGSVDPTTLSLCNRSVWLYSVKPSQDGVPTDLTLASDFSVCFRGFVDSS